MAGILIGAIAVYLLLFAFSYMGDPLARAPQLDAGENLGLAGQFDEGTFPPEPFYRAVLYPYLLSLLHPLAFRPLMGLLLGLACHAANGWMLHRLASHIWRSPAAALLSAGLYLLNPASLFYAAQLLDITPAISCLLGALTLTLKGPAGWTRALMGGLLLGLCVALRPHFLPLALLLPAILALTSSLLPGQAAGMGSALMGVLLLQGGMGFHLSGEFRLLPWQGAYNLWAANKPGANGLYFKQSLDVASRPDQQANPTRVESEVLYGKAHPDEIPPFDVSSMNAWWRSQFIRHVMDNPLQVVHLWFHKAYAVANSFEQYNNLTFSFHKERLPVLRANPLNWGILLLLGSLGLLQLWRDNRKLALVLLLLILAYASTLILFYASARFRLPLVPFMALLAGGAIAWIRHLPASRRDLIASVLLVAALGLLTFSSFGNIRSTETYLQDRLLLANAHAELGEDLPAAHWARQVLEESPHRQEARRIYAVSYFNLAITGHPERIVLGDWIDQQPWLGQRPPTDPVQDAILGIYFWKWGHTEAAIQTWEWLLQSQAPLPLAEAALLATATEPDTSESPLVRAMRDLLNE